MSEEKDQQIRRLIDRSRLSEVLNRNGVQFWGMGWWPALGGLGPQKKLENIAGLKSVWHQAFDAITSADTLVVVGFSLSEFDVMAKSLLATARKTRRESQYLPAQRVLVVDPSNDVLTKYKLFFGSIEGHNCRCEYFDWANLNSHNSSN